jgi:hypothetical protein|tara:strand:- start:1444 stop:2049 length:606 start_codon:yes stop_codon:yes gene_type:complete
MSKYDLTNKMVSAFTLYKFVEEISKPFTSFKAYRDGVIDQNGNFLVSVDDIDPIGMNLSTFDLFVIYIKRLLDQIPNPTTKGKLRSTTSALSLFKESLQEYELDSDLIINGLMDFFVEDDILDERIVEFIINELAPVNSMGGNFATGQVGNPGNLAGFSPPLFAGMSRRKEEDEDEVDDLYKLIKRRRRKRKNPLQNIKRK